MSDLAVDDGDELEELSRTKVGGKRVLLIVVALLVLLLGGGAAAFFTGMLDPLLGGSEEMAEDGGHGAADGEHGEEGGEKLAGIFYDIDNMLVNLNTPGRQPRFLKMSISIELENQSDVARLEQLLPRVNDQFQTYLRELRVEDLQGSAGIYRLRQELLARVSQAIYPAKVRNVLFREMLIQ
ncbi:MAG: flagellar basal body protein FliL [Alphaproteobacteria bacterium]|nr:flagellar basal body protein FliL [Alphaproteobacteria bacterium]MAS49094.1 flagellar basal body protein FliL [Alphaproteobacteria bacterium]MAX97304.1 flagellar basal body protein FliL [Alphaproteobacteria bacterium]MBN52518.1 flagellar basal body protein FliL [Alphaproteobacteria bacterium]OUT39698.1 MAG: flagellar basal body protein FliL [Micavibrio sp. TMED2]|tara:strand:+ start:33671 stop:34216 length:546 start_codon:yes stop_codon:yes gene_type:complete